MKHVNNFNTFLAEGKLHEAEIQFDSNNEGKTNKHDFAFWYKPGVRGKAQALKAKELLKQNGIDAIYSKNPFYIGFSNSNVEQRAVMQLLRDAGLTNFVVTNKGKLAENIFGKYATRKAPKDTSDPNHPDYDLYMGNDNPEYRKFYMALERLIKKSDKKLDKNFEILDWIESLLNHIKPEK